MIEIGQDARMRWAWILKSESGELIASGDNHFSMRQAIIMAFTAWEAARDAGDSRCTATPQFIGID